jgi:hypothetical protein
VLAQPGGFFLHLGSARRTVLPSTKLARAGAILIGAALVTLPMGLIHNPEMQLATVDIALDTNRKGTTHVAT